MSALSSASAPFSRRNPRELILYTMIKAVSGLAGLLGAIIVTRALGPEFYGFYSTSWFLTITCSMLGFSWLSQCVLRFRAESLLVAGRKDLIKALIWSGVATALAAVLGALLTFRALQASSPVILFCLAGAAVCLGLITISQAIFQSRILPMNILRIEAIKYTLLLVLVPVLAFHWRGKVFLALGIFLALLITLTFSLRPWRELLSPDSQQVVAGDSSSASLRFYFSYGISLTLFSVGLTGLPVLERYFLLTFFDQTQAGNYIGVYDVVVRGFTVGLMPVTLALHPRIMDAYNAGDLARSNRLIHTGLLIQAGLAVMMAVVILAISPFLFQLLKISEPFSPRLLLTLCAAGAAWQLALIVQKPLERGNKTHAVLLCFGVSLAVIVVLDNILPRTHGLAGIALANLAGACSYLVLVGGLGVIYDRIRSPLAVAA